MTCLADIGRTELVRGYGSALQDGAAALFLGAGMSRASGQVDWRELMKEIASDLQLDINLESDLVAVAQYSFNKYQSRDRLNQRLITEFSKDARPTENHQLISSLPIRKIWTTNYDKLIERAMEAAHKRLDVKSTAENLATTVPGRDAILYKMHGDISQPHDAVVTKEDYETYSQTHEAFTIALQSDLLQKTFLILGFSFTDPNIDYILSRIRGLLGQNQRTHYCVMRRPSKPGNASDQARFEYEARKLELRVGDLKRYSIQTVLIDRHEEITDILRELKRRAFLRDIFVSGSAHDYSPMGKHRIDSLARALGREIVRRRYNLVSGLGLGIGATVVIGALEEKYSRDASQGEIRYFPFPQEAPAGLSLAQAHFRFREEMLANVGFSIFICGNRLAQSSNEIEVGKGVLEEFDLIVKLGRYPIPVGASGHAAKQIWEMVMTKPSAYYGTDVTSELGVLGDVGRGNDEYIAAIFNIISKLSR